MGKFSRRLKHNKKSLSIDEKIKFLDKEMEKTGLNEVAANSTAGVYVSTPTTPNSEYADFTAKNFNGVPFAMSGDSNLGQGSFGGASIRASDGAALSPDGTTTQTKGELGSGGFKLAIPGQRSTPEHRMTGPIMWYWTGSSWGSLEYNSAAVHGNQPYPYGGDNAGWGYWGSNFLGFPMLRSDGDAFASLFNTIDNFDPKDSVPETVVLTKDRVDDPSFMPPKIPGMSDEAFRALLRRLGYDPDSPDPDDPDKTEIKKGEKDEGEEEEEGELVFGMTQEEVEAKFGHLDADGLARRGIIRNPDGSYREMTEQEQKAYRQKQLDKAALVVARAAGVSVKTVQRIWSNGTVAGNVTKNIDSFLKGNTGFDFLDDLSNKMSKPILKFLGKFAKVPSPSNFLLRYDKWLASGGRGKVDMTRYIDPKSARVLTRAANNFAGKGMKEFYKLQLKMNGGNEKQALETLAGFVETNVDDVCNADSSNFNLKMSIGNGIQLDKKAFVASKGKVIRFSKGYKFAEGVGSVAGADKTPLGQFARGLGVELDTFGDGSYMVPAVLGAKYGLQTVNRQYKGSPDAAPVMPYSFTVKSPFSGDINESYWKTYEWIDLSQVNNQQVSLQEDVKLGHFDPEALTVDIEDIRKGILPEFPKKAPPKMIDGHSEKSKLAPKQLPKDSFIKITKKDLAKNHKLKDSEIKEFMRQIDAVNEYIQKHPEELIYVQQRYPVNDKRLAALNFKMDQMLESGEEYIDTQFPENQRLVDRIKKATKKTMELTNPEAYKNLNKPDMELMSLDDHMKEKRIVSRHFKKKRQNKSMFRVDMEKVKEKNRKMAEQKVAEWQEKRRIELLNSNEFENDKSDWKKDLQDK